MTYIWQQVLCIPYYVVIPSRFLKNWSEIRPALLIASSFTGERPSYYSNCRRRLHRRRGNPFTHTHIPLRTDGSETEVAIDGLAAEKAWPLRCQCQVNAGYYPADHHQNDAMTAQNTITLSVLTNSCYSGQAYHLHMLRNSYDVYHIHYFWQITWLTSVVEPHKLRTSFPP